MFDPDLVAENVAAVGRRIAAVERTWSHDVALVAVTKGFDERAVEAVCAAGCRRIGENYAQELLAKREAVECCRAEVHFIGRLQSNKVRQLTDLVAVWESIDRRSLVDELTRRCPGARMLVQVNTTGEPAKGGCPPDAVPELVAAARAAGLHVEGLMTVGPTGAPAEAARPGFRTTRRLVDELGLDTCSMGMSDDLVVAVEEGSTEVRVGTAIFGPRPLRA